MGNKNFNPNSSNLRARRGFKHISKRVNGETAPTQADQITEIQAKKRM
ncbi:hypothetical protein LCL89_08215 [Halobacillus yeomjeoni]|uniref:YpzG family protein n=1 Tax=Halobacillus yeomjeoni TaxID=311194 RepID=A0A931HX78_9BACI|nr:hypothetical protein [Halobacillus yeomjeoni]MBH0231113.1 hypothetical protein [Halobacillus yeomjeoni]MCA0984026.1 hypothetical protein [Halobacillus yeomjeoni]